MIEICRESAGFDTTSHMIADQDRIIVKKCWLSDLGILEIWGQLILEEYAQERPLTQIETLNVEKQITTKSVTTNQC